MKLFNHVQIKVNDLLLSKQFYDIIMPALGYNIVLAAKDVIGYGLSTHDMLEIRQANHEHRLSCNLHIAFNAPSKMAVDDFYHQAIANKAKCNGAPGFRPQYEEGYYAAFVIDPDGHNIEAVFISI